MPGGPRAHAPRPSQRRVACVLPALTPASGHGASLVRARSASAVDWVAAGIGGVPGDTAHITVSGVTGPVTKAYLYWGGLNAVLSTSFYDNPTVTIDGNR